MNNKKQHPLSKFALLSLILIGGFFQSCAEKEKPMVNKVEIKKSGWQI